MPQPRLYRLRSLWRLMPASSLHHLPRPLSSSASLSFPFSSESTESPSLFTLHQNEQHESRSSFGSCTKGAAIFAGCSHLLKTLYRERTCIREFTQNASSFAKTSYLLRQSVHTFVVQGEPHINLEASEFDTEHAIEGEYVELHGTKENSSNVSPVYNKESHEAENEILEGVVIAAPVEEHYQSESIEQEEPVLLEGAEPQEDPEGRSYLHILSVEDVQKILERVRGENVQVIPVRDLCEWADYLVITSGYSARHLRGIADSIVFEVKKRSTNVGPNLYPTVEGRDSDQWMVVDCGSVVVHVFREDVRNYYNLEELWRKKRTLNLTDGL